MKKWFRIAIPSGVITGMVVLAYKKVKDFIGGVKKRRKEIEEGKNKTRWL